MVVWFSPNHWTEFSNVRTIFRDNFRADFEDYFMAEFIVVNDSPEIC